MTLDTRLQKTETGFTLIEALVAVSIMTISIAGPLYTASRAIVAAQNARDQLTASYLAQEGIEYVRMMRDNAYLAVRNQSDASSAAWATFLAGIGTSCASPNFCTLDPDPTLGVGIGSSIKVCSGTCAPLYLSTANIYNQREDGAKTAFTRTIQVNDVTGTDKQVVSEVLWDFHGTQYSVTVTDHLTPWQ